MTPTPGQRTDTRAWRALLVAHQRAVRGIEADLAAAGRIPLTWYDVLLELNEAKPDRRLTMGERSERVVVISRTRLSRVVDELVGAGLVVREPNPADRRSSYARLTEAGRARLRQAAPTYLAGIERRFTAHLSAEEAHTIAAALGRVLAADRPVSS
jgi:DNA-binding MarR family transcriptional regulator